MPFNTKIDLMYRDAANWKAVLPVVLRGEINIEQVKTITSSLHDGEFIIASQVDLPTPSLKFADYESFPDDEIDHVWTTMPDLSDMSGLLTAQPPTVEMTVQELTEKISKAKWDILSEWDRITGIC